ncbi:MAG: biotin/lipoyl-binding protein [Chloroflexi bacterium]|nr:biotin/lipoyl-binding protein [Chloroflexota bacterium]
MSRRQLTQCMSLLFVTIMFSSCALLPTGRSDRAASEAPTPTPIPTAIVPTKPTYKVQKGEVVDELTFSGRISPVLENELYFRTDGRVRTVFSKRNDVVKKGTVIAELENDALERDLKSAELELERGTVTLEAAKRELDFSIKIAQNNLDIEQLKLAKLQAQAAPDQNDIAVQQKEIEQAQINVDRLNSGVDPLLVNSVQSAQLNVDKLKTQIAEAQIAAPFDGQLLSVSLSPGQEIKGYQAVVVLADVNNLEVSADLLSDQMTKLVENMPANIVLVSRPGEILKGKVRQLPYPYGSGGRGQKVEDQDKSTRFSVETSAKNAGFALGDLVRITVELERKANVLWLPPQALRVFEGRRFAVVQDGDAQRRVDVTVGIQTQERVEIKEGLKEGQVVVGQ